MTAELDNRKRLSFAYLLWFVGGFLGKFKMSASQLIVDCTK